VIGNDWYVFRRGKGLLKLPASHVTGSRQRGLFVPGSKAYLDSKVGLKWSYRENCATVFSTIWRKQMASNADDRNAIAKSVIVAMVMLFLAGGGVVLTVQKVWIDPNIDAILGAFESAKNSRKYYSGVFKDELDELRKACEIK
jgi:hypothetical protein